MGGGEEETTGSEQVGPVHSEVQWHSHNEPVVTFSPPFSQTIPHLQEQASESMYIPTGQSFPFNVHSNKKSR